VAVNQETALSLVKARLNRLDANLDVYLTQRVAAAVEELTRIGIQLNDSADDLMLVVDYTVWQYQNRDTPGAMPEWLRLRRRERWIHIDEEAGT
jgi:hypothetical protein